MSSATRRAHTRAIRRRNTPRPRNLITVQIRGDASRARRQIDRVTQGLAELAEYKRRLGATASRAAYNIARMGALLTEASDPGRGDLHLMVVTTTNGSRLVAQRLGGWQRMRPTPSERNL